MRNNRPPFLAEANEPVGSAWLSDSHQGSIFGKDRIGHSTPDAQYVLASYPVPNEDGGYPISRIAEKISSNNVSIARAGMISNSSVSYDASKLR